jgi:hypothetical protein
MRSEGHVVSCDLLYSSASVNDWGPITQAVNFKGSLLSSAPNYAFCKCVHHSTPLAVTTSALGRLGTAARPNLSLG